MAEVLGIRPWEQKLLTYRQWLMCKDYIDKKLAPPEGEPEDN